MLRPALAALVASLTLLAAAPPAQAAAHNASWQSDGIATDLAGNVYIFSAHYHGQFCGPEYFTIELRAEDNTLLERRNFAGFQTFVPYATGPYSEAFSADGRSTTLGVTFNYNAQQWFVLNGGPLTQVVRGTYQGLTFVVTSVLEPWTFCS